MRTALCPGSFDPFTVGHLDVIRRAAAIFDSVIVLVLENPDKKPSFSAAERRQMIELACQDLKNVSADSFSGFVTEYAREKGASVIVKGLRNNEDFGYEFQMSAYNRKLNPDVETLFLMAEPGHMTLSSSAVKTVARFGGDIRDYVPAELHDRIRQRLTRGRESRI